MKIIIIGSPGAGKSTLARRIGTKLCLPVLHLDKIFHTGGKKHISRSDLLKTVNEFADSHHDWLIDGNYISTIKMRINLADTVILMDIPTDTCIKNVYERAKKAIDEQGGPEDMANGFDYTLEEEFIEFIKNFKKDTIPLIKKELNKNPEKNVTIIQDYGDIEGVIAKLKGDNSV